MEQGEWNVATRDREIEGRDKYKWRWMHCNKDDVYTIVVLVTG